jgi:hypothetical protein
MIFFNNQISTIIFENLPHFSIDACQIGSKCVPMIFFHHQISTIIFEILPHFSIDACQIGY